MASIFPNRGNRWGSDFGNSTIFTGSTRTLLESMNRLTIAWPNGAKVGALCLDSADLHSELCDQVVFRVRAETGPWGTSIPPLITGTVLANGVAPKSANIRSSGETFSFAARQCSTARKAGPI